METIPKKESKDEENYFSDKDEIPPDSDIKYQYKGNSPDKKEKNDEENEDQKINKEENKQKEESKENPENVINKENQENSNNEEEEDVNDVNKEEKTENDEKENNKKEKQNEKEQQNEINQENQIREDKPEGQTDIVSEQKDNYEVAQELGQYTIAPSGQVYEIIQTKEGYQEYQVIPSVQTYPINQNGQEYEISNQIQEYPITQQSQKYQQAQQYQEYELVQPEQGYFLMSQENQQNDIYQTFQTGEYQINQEGEVYQNEIQGQEYQTILPNQNYQISEQGQIYEIVQQNQGYPIIQSSQEYQFLNMSDQGYQNIQYGQPYEIIEQTKENQYLQTGQQNQIYQALGQPFEYQEDYKSYTPVNLGLNQNNEIKKSYEPEINHEEKEYNENLEESNENQQNKFNNEINQNHMDQFRKGIHLASSNTKDENQKTKRKNSQPKDSITKKVAKSKDLKNSSHARKNKASSYIPKLVSFQDISTKKRNVDSRVSLDKQNFSEFIEVPRNEYEGHADIETIFIDSGMDSGKYKFKGKEELIKENQTPSKIKISEEDVMNEIEKRTSNKKNKKLKYIVLDKYFSLTDFDQKDKKDAPINSKDSNIPNINNENNIKPDSESSLTPKDNYSRYLLEQINKIRIDPQSFIGVIEDAKANIEKHRYGGFIYKGKIKIALCDGEPAFNEAIDFLQNTESMGKLEFCPQLTAQLPQNEDEIKDRDDLRIKVEKMIDNGINIRSYWKDLIKDPEISFLLMIVDDNGSRRGMRRRDLLNPHIKYIGISSVEINNNFVCYITLSSKLEK